MTFESMGSVVLLKEQKNVSWDPLKSFAQTEERKKERKKEAKRGLVGKKRIEKERSPREKGRTVQRERGREEKECKSKNEVIECCLLILLQIIIMIIIIMAW